MASRWRSSGVIGLRAVDFEETIDRRIAEDVVNVPVRIFAAQESSAIAMAVAAMAAVSARRIVFPNEADIQPALAN